MVKNYFYQESNSSSPKQFILGELINYMSSITWLAIIEFFLQQTIQPKCFKILSNMHK